MSQIVYRVRMPDGGYMGRQAGIVPRSLPSMIDSWTTSISSIAKDMAESVGGNVIKTTVSPKRRCGTCKYFAFAAGVHQCFNRDGGMSLVCENLLADDFCSRWEAK